MEENNKQTQSIWGKWWIPIRKWFYPIWLIYETSYRFYDYAQSTHQYFISHQYYFGIISSQTLAILTSILSFTICTAFLTVPTYFILYSFFKSDNLTGSRIEEKMKRLL